MFLFNFSITVLLATAMIQHTSPEFYCFYKYITGTAFALVLTTAMKTLIILVKVIIPAIIWVK